MVSTRIITTGRALTSSTSAPRFPRFPRVPCSHAPPNQLRKVASTAAASPPEPVTRVAYTPLSFTHRNTDFDESLLEHHQWYAPDSREGPRDETWPKWKTYGATRERSGISKNASSPRWAITASFADLFNPSLEGAALTDAIDAWRAIHMEPGERIRIQYADDLAKAGHQVLVVIPGYGVRYLEPGKASHIIKGVVEEWAPRRLHTPVVVAISEPGTKIAFLDAAKMADAGILINASSVLPDVIILDAGTKPPTFWIIEAVHSKGEVSEGRKIKLLAWAQDQYIKPEQCRFLSAFSSRNSAPARQRLMHIAVGTYCWFLDEPNRELAWNELPEKS